MSERVREINFRFFRGLPDYTCTLKGKNLLILGGNGKGKSAIVDGIEFLFSGTIRRFHGEGSGRINPDLVIPHVHHNGKPEIKLKFTPSNGSISRIHKEKGSLYSKNSQCQSYINLHPPVESFILRRGQILDFINDTDAKRYQKFIRLLGLNLIDQTQRGFGEAIQIIEDNIEERQNELNSILKKFYDSEKNWMPKNAKDIFSKCFSEISKFGIKFEKDIQGLKNAIVELDLKRSHEDKQILDDLNIAISRVETKVLSGIESQISEINNIHEQLRKLKRESSEYEKANIVKEGFDYFQKYPEIINCPLCEQKLEEGYAKTFERLEERNEALNKFYKFETLRTNKIESLIYILEQAVYQLNQEKEDHYLYKENYLEILLKYYDKLKNWIDKIKYIKGENIYDNIVCEKFIGYICEIRFKIHKDLMDTRNYLIELDTLNLEKTNSLLKKVEEKIEDIVYLESSISKDKELHSQLINLEKAYTKAREFAIQRIFNMISDIVINYYTHLHQISYQETSDCTQLKLIPTSRAAAGGLQLAIEFLENGELNHPLAYLSDGHLDSLGICLYLASVRLFNASGSLLILDDIITSIDKEHRNRLTELLLEEFSDYQLIITTHDEYWFKKFQDLVEARGVQNKWAFKRISRWTLESGPESSAYEGTWDWIYQNLKEDAYRELGGSLRLVFEDFLKRVAEKIELEIVFRIDGNYTAGHFVKSGIEKEIRELIIKKDPSLEVQVIREVGRVFGSEALINYLSHDNPGRLEIQFQETVDFVTGLEELGKMCKEHGLIKGHSGI